MIKQPNGTCVTQADQTVEQVYSLRKCVKECLRSNIDCQGVTYDDTKARCNLSREITLKLCDNGTSSVTFTTGNGLESSFDTRTVSVATTTTTSTTTTTQPDYSYPTPTPTGTKAPTALAITTIAAQPTTSQFGQLLILPYFLILQQTKDMLGC